MKNGQILYLIDTYNFSFKKLTYSSDEHVVILELLAHKDGENLIGYHSHINNGDTFSSVRWYTDERLARKRLHQVASNNLQENRQKAIIARKRFTNAKHVIRCYKQMSQEPRRPDEQTDEHVIADLEHEQTWLCEACDTSYFGSAIQARKHGWSVYASDCWCPNHQ